MSQLPTISLDVTAVGLGDPAWVDIDLAGGVVRAVVPPERRDAILRAFLKLDREQTAQAPPAQAAKAEPPAPAPAKEACRTTTKRQSSWNGRFALTSEQRQLLERASVLAGAGTSLGPIIGQSRAFASNVRTGYTRLTEESEAKLRAYVDGHAVGEALAVAPIPWPQSDDGRPFNELLIELCEIVDHVDTVSEILGVSSPTIWSWRKHAEPRKAPREAVLRALVRARAIATAERRTSPRVLVDRVFGARKRTLAEGRALRLRVYSGTLSTEQKAALADVLAETPSDLPIRAEQMTEEGQDA